MCVCVHVCVCACVCVPIYIYFKISTNGIFANAAGNHHILIVLTAYSSRHLPGLKIVMAKTS